MYTGPKGVHQQCISIGQQSPKTDRVIIICNMQCSITAAHILQLYDDRQLFQLLFLVRVRDVVLNEMCVCVFLCCYQRGDMTRSCFGKVLENIVADTWDSTLIS